MASNRGPQQLAPVLADCPGRQLWEILDQDGIYSQLQPDGDPDAPETIGTQGHPDEAHSASCYDTSFTSGTFQVPSSNEGGVSVGQYSRIMRMNCAEGAGSQLASLSLPGDSRWM